jgi:hypothetical protein
MGRMFGESYDPSEEEITTEEQDATDSEALGEMMQEITQEQVVAGFINTMCADVHEANQKWWHDLHTGERLKRDPAQLLMLTVSELAEAGEDAPQYSAVLFEVTKSLCRAMEGVRKDKMDDKLPERKAFEVELADAVIRIFDIAAGFDLDLGGAYVEKMAYNAVRKDHTAEARLQADGKRF